MNVLINRIDIRIRDPFVVTDHENKIYYLYGTTDKNAWKGEAEGFNAYKSSDLENWEGPFPVFRPDENFWSDRNFWAPEVYFYDGKYIMFASFKAENKCRGTQVLSSVHPLGPFKPITEEPVTPRNWECLDGTLFIDHEENPWMVFCHEWIQIKDGKICAMKLSKDLRKAVSAPVTLFSASEAKWPRRGKHYITDGPYFHHNKQGELLMIWSSTGEKGYAIGIARSKSGDILGPWEHEEETLFAENGGHGMLFKTFNDELMLTFHAPNDTPQERPVFFPVKEVEGLLVLDTD